VVGRVAEGGVRGMGYFWEQEGGVGVCLKTHVFGQRFPTFPLLQGHSF